MSEPPTKYIPQRYVAPLPSVLVCPHCKHQVTLSRHNEGWRETFHCPAHGRVSPMRSAVVNPGSEWPDWSAT